MSKDQIVMQAQTFAGLSAGKTLDVLLTKILRHDTRANAEYAAKHDSNCGYVCEGILDLSGVDGTVPWHGVTKDWLRAPMAERIGSAVAFQRALFQYRKMWVDATHWKPGDPIPDDADMPEISGPSHVLTCLWRRSPSLGDTKGVLAVYDTIEGGQHDSVTGEDSAVLQKVRELVVHNGRLAFIDPTFGFRPIVGWGKAGEMPCVF